jgi:hypothetical protein
MYPYGGLSVHERDCQDYRLLAPLNEHVTDMHDCGGRGEQTLGPQLEVLVDTLHCQ